MQSATVKFAAHNIQMFICLALPGSREAGQLPFSHHHFKVQFLCLQGVAAKLCTTMPLDGASAGEPDAEALPFRGWPNHKSICWLPP